MISTIAYLITDNEDVVIAFGLGIIGLFLSAIMKIIQKIVKLFKYHIGKRSIFEEENSGSKFKCRTSNTNDVQWVSGYKLIKRYATKMEWSNIPDFSNVFILKSKKIVIVVDITKYVMTSVLKVLNANMMSMVGF